MLESTMSNSEAVKRWRKNTKSRIIKAMGGKCQSCGYDKCDEALELHHIDPNEKEIGIGRIRANPSSWSKIVTELRKCILLCSNCHREVHSGVIDIPKVYQKFDESFSQYKDSTKLTPCVVCGKMKPERNKTCSHICAGKLGQSKIDWNCIDLESELKLKSFTQIARELDISDAAVRKRAKRLNLI